MTSLGGPFGDYRVSSVLASKDEMNIRLALLMAILISGGLALAAYITVRQVPMWTEQDLARHEMLRLAIAASRNFLQFWFYLFPVIVLLCYGIVGLMAGTGGAKKDAKAH